MKILVTGGAGFIGSNFLYYALAAHGEDSFVCLDKLTYAGNEETLRPLFGDPRFRFCRGDICDRGAVFSLFERERPDAVVNFAAESHVDRSIDSPEVFMQTNAVGVCVLLEACRAFGGVRFHQVSTDEVYGDLPLSGGEPFTETSPLRPGSPYAASKAAGDLYALAAYRTYRVPVTVSRSSNNYGRFQYPEKLIPLAVSRLLSGEKVPVYGTGENVRDWIAVSDHCRAIDCILRRGKAGEVYNVSAGCEVSNLTLVRRLCRLLGYPEDAYTFVQDRKGHDLRYALSAEKLRALGWAPEVAFGQGLAETAAWYVHNKNWWQPLLKKD